MGRGAWSSEHRAQGTEHRAQGTGHRAQSTGLRAQGKTIRHNNMITIRTGTPDDAKTIISFQQAMAMETEGLKLNDEILGKGVMSVFENPSKGGYYVAESEDTVIASLLITYEWSDWRNADVWWFQSVYVLPQFRRMGIFRKLYDFIKTEAEKAGVAGLRLYVESNNFPARKTYEAMGMSSEHYTMYEWLR